MLAFVEACRGTTAEMGRLMAESHPSMRDDYQITCAEIDYLVETAGRQAGHAGARMTGGGFGGCTVNLVRSDAVEGFRGSGCQPPTRSALESRPRSTPARPPTGARELR